MPERAWRYALPRDVVEKHHVRKYGAHGTSHRFIWRTVNEFMEGKAHKLVTATWVPAPPCVLSRTAAAWTPPWAHPARRPGHGHPLRHLGPRTVFYLSRVGGYSIDEIGTP